MTTSGKTNTVIRWIVVALLLVLFLRSVIFGVSAVEDGSKGTLVLAGFFLVIQTAFLLAAIGWARNR